MVPPHINWPSTIDWIEDSTIIQQKFNKGQYFERLQKGEFTHTTFKCKHRSPKTEPKCTHSQMLVYWESKVKPVALVHQYLRPDGKLGGSGKPDPKIIVVGNKAIALKYKN